jgi:glyoxylase-like metal-dependent hydrolase (beta-lactamase superfamily II)
MINRRSLIKSAAALGAAAFPGIASAKAPMLGVQPANIHRMKFGSFEITSIRDGQVTLDKPWTVFGENQKPETVQAVAKLYNLPTDKHTITFTPLIVNTGNELVLFDTGWGSGNPGRGELAASIGKAGYKLEDIDVVVLTHFHPDHMGGLMDGDKPVFPNARYVTGENEHNFWTNPAQEAGDTKDFYNLTKAKVTPLAAKTTFVKDQANAATGITAVTSPGHTPGHLSWRIESDGQQMIVGGDICNHNVLSMERPNWHVLFDMDKEQATATRIRMLDMVSHDRIPLYCYHMPFPAVGFVYKHASEMLRYHWEPAAYQFTL